MSLQDLLFPLYCPNCENLTFLHQGEQGSKLVDFVPGGFEEHPCQLAESKAIHNHPKIQKMLQIDPSRGDLPFWPRRGELDLRSKIQKAVLIHSPNEKDSFYQFLTPANQVLRLKPQEAFQGQPAGKVLKIENLVRVGQGAFRVKEPQWEKLGANPLPPVSLPEEAYRVILTGSDAEVVERQLQRLLAFAHENLIRVIGVYPSALPADGRPEVYRELTLLPGPNQLATFMEVNLPEQVSLKLQQLTFT